MNDKTRQDTSSNIGPGTFANIAATQNAVNAKIVNHYNYTNPMAKYQYSIDNYNSKLPTGN